MTAAGALDTLYDVAPGVDLPLPPELAALYGHLRFPAHPGRPHTVANFVATLDGVVSLGASGQGGGGEISGFEARDRMVMGLLRAAADAVVVGAGTLRSVPEHLWTAEYIYPPLADAYGRFRRGLGKLEPPLNVVVTAGGGIDFDWPVFRSGRVPALVVTTGAGAQRLAGRPRPEGVRVAAVADTGEVSARATLDAVRRARPSRIILVEGGPHLLGGFLADECLDELFLTIAPQVAGRAAGDERPGLVAGQLLAPGRPRWSTLVGVKRGGSHLFLRYAFRAADA